jgi:hypothetical protein
MNNFLRAFMFFLLLVLLSGSYLINSDVVRKKSRILINDDYNYIAVNQIKMWFSNNGDGSHDPLTDGNGLYWPGGVNAVKSAVFQDGLIFGGKLNGETRVNGNTHRQGLQAGKIINGLPDDPSLPKYRIYKILKGWENLPPGPEKEQYEADYNNWPVEDGAPWVDINEDGIYTPGIDVPEFIGDETAWYVANDMDPSRSTFTYGTMPMGLEFQTTIFAFNNTGALGNMVFKKYLILNKGENTIDSMYLGYWADPDLGAHWDDYAGCDSNLNLGYVYNAENMDGDGTGPTYGLNPPAVGYNLLQGPIVPGEPDDSAMFKNTWIKGYKNLSMTSFVAYFSGTPVYRDPSQGIPAGSIEQHNYLSGVSWDGSPFINPINNQVTKYILSGDPAEGTGWYQGEGWPGGVNSPGDRRLLISSGPFTFAPGDTQEVVIGILLARGNSNLNSVTHLKNHAEEMRSFYYGGFDTTLVDVKDQSGGITGYILYQNYPNPFNPSTTIKYNLPSASFVSLTLYNVLGKEVRTMVKEFRQAGINEVEFNAGNLPSGIYFYELKAEGYSAVRKMIILK